MTSANALTYRKKPVEVRAIQWTGDNINQIWDVFGAAGIYGPTEKNPGSLILTTIHGDEAVARVGDWVIAEPVPGRFYPCKPDIFEATYEQVSVASSGLNLPGSRPGQELAAHIGADAARKAIQAGWDALRGLIAVRPDLVHPGDGPEAEARGYARAIAALRDRDRYLRWHHAHVEPRSYVGLPLRDVLADYLEVVAPEGGAGDGD